MLNKLKNMLGFGPQINFAELKQKGAVIVDVRTRAEYNGGHIKGSLNIPLQDLQKNLRSVPKNKPVITCCASGMRSASALKVLRSNGYFEVYNGGGWTGLKNKF
jgi:phage shock protein E